MRNAPLRIYLADLTHTGLGVATEAFPLNIGLIASYARKEFGDAIQVTLFKYPEDLRNALLHHPPHLLGCSNYTWNSRLGLHFLELAKSLDPKMLTVWGGTNYPFDPENQKAFLLQRPALDLHTFYEAEVAFSHIVERALGSLDHEAFFSEPIPGCQFIRKGDGEFCSGAPLPRIKELDSILSPYATGLLDQFFDGKLTPLLETSRGCPFTCNFCNAGNVYFNRVNLFSDGYVREEWEYVARQASRVGIGHMTLADNNFGMIPRDPKTAELMYELKNRYGWPRSVTAWTGKNSKKRVIDVTRLLGETLLINMAVQSMDGTVLKNIARSNIKLEDYKAIAEELNDQGRPQVAEVIVPLPGETWASHLQGIRDLLDSSVSTIIVHTLQMLHGTPYKDNSGYVQEHGFLRKYRVVPLDFGLYEGKPVFDIEEVSVATHLFSLEDYVESRKLLLLIDLCYNGTIGEVLKKYIRSHNLKISDWLESLYRQISHFSPSVQAIFDHFVSETLGELWDSEEELVRFYSQPDHYQELLRGDVGGNVLYKHRAWMMSKLSQEWIDAVFSISETFLKDRLSPQGGCALSFELQELKRFALSSIQDVFELSLPPTVITEGFQFDVLAWLHDDDSIPLGKYRQWTPVRLNFSFDEEQLLIRREASVRYGSNLPGVIKFMQRVGEVRRLLRRATYQADVSSDNRTERILG